MNVDISVVIPIYCERENLPELHRRLSDVFEAFGRHWEIVFVNDCSLDDSLEIMRELARDDERVKVVSFSRNFGHQTAITAGLRYATGDSVILMDGDLQDPPEALPDLITKKEEGNWDVVYAIRKKRKEPILIRCLYFIYYRMLRRSSYIDIPLDSGDFCIMSRRVADHLNAMRERNPFVRGLRSWVGFRQTGMDYERAPRLSGKPKYSFRSLVKLAFDGIFSFSYLPLRISTYLGLVLSFAGLGYATWVFFQRIAGGVSFAGWATVLISILVLGGVQLIMLGVIGEYLGRIYEELKARPQYIVEELIGFDEASMPEVRPAAGSGD